MWKSLENPHCFVENGSCLLQPCSYQCLVSSLGITNLDEMGTIFSNYRNGINSKWEGESQWNDWKFMGEKCLDSLLEKSIKNHSPADQLLPHLSPSAHTVISLIVFKNFPAISWNWCFYLVAIISWILRKDYFLKKFFFLPEFLVCLLVDKKRNWRSLCFGYNSPELFSPPPTPPKGLIWLKGWRLLLVLKEKWRLVCYSRTPTDSLEIEVLCCFCSTTAWVTDKPVTALPQTAEKGTHFQVDSFHRNLIQQPSYSLS